MMLIQTGNSALKLARKVEKKNTDRLWIGIVALCVLAIFGELSIEYFSDQRENAEQASNP